MTAPTFKHEIQMPESQEQSGDRHVLFRLTSERLAAIELSQVQEAIVIPARQITPIPNMHASILGLMSSQDRVFAAIDLAYFLGLSTRVWHAREYSVIVISTSPANSHPTKPSEHSDGFTYLGLCIREILGNASFRSEDIRSPKGEFPDPIAHFLSGWIDRNSERVHVLDVRALIQD